MTARDFPLQDEFLQALIADEALQEEIPTGAMLVLLPDDDPALTEHNIAQGITAARRGMNVYFRHLRQSPETAP